MVVHVSSPDAAAVGYSDDVAAIIRRAALMGIPAWRITTALGLAPVASR